MDRRQAEIGGKDYLVFLYVYYTPLYPFASAQVTWTLCKVGT